MNEITICGASDDLIEVEGAIKAEFYASSDGGDSLAFSDGTVLSIIYTPDGFWRINRTVTGSANMTKEEATDPDGDYSDRVTLMGEIKWVVCGECKHAKP